jgi:hypothetical protein
VDEDHSPSSKALAEEERLTTVIRRESPAGAGK